MVGRIDSNISSKSPKARDAWAVQHIGQEEKYTILKSTPSEMAMTTATATPTAITTTKGRRGPATAQVHQPKEPEPMFKQPFKVEFQNIHYGIMNTNIILEEGVRRDQDIIFLAEPLVEKKVGGQAITVQTGFDMVSILV